MKKSTIKMAAAAVLSIAALTCVSCGQVNDRGIPEEMSIDNINTGSVNTGGSLHDPQVIIGEDGTYYCYGTHMTAATSTDLIKWDSWADGVNGSNKIFDNLLAEPFDAFSFVGKNEQNGYSVWAPSVIYNKATKKYMMFFCTTSSYIKSNIVIATADDIGGPYHYEKTIIYSGFTKSDLDLTNYTDIMGDDISVRSRYISGGAYNNQLWPNAIDPAMFYDENDKLWMVYGSWSGGIFLLELDEQTGEPIHPETNDDEGVDAYFGKRLVGGFHHPIEGPYIHYDKDAGYYYLFLSYGNLQMEGGYQIRVFRSKNPDGPYEDATGATLSEEGYTTASVQGTFYVVDHGLDVNNIVNKPVECHFEDGKISGGMTGTYSVNEKTNFITFESEDVTYHGIMVRMTDEAGNDTFCISAVGDNDHSIWGVQYLENTTE